MKTDDVVMITEGDHAGRVGQITQCLPNGWYRIHLAHLFKLRSVTLQADSFRLY